MNRAIWILCWPLLMFSACVGVNTPQYYLRIAGNYYQQGRYHAAIEACQKALSKDPFYKEAQYNLGNAFMKIGHYDNAIHAYQQALWIQENYPQPHYGLAVAYAQTGKIDAARGEINKYLELVPNDDNARVLREQLESESQRRE
ncbi:MAG: tetratricopeptide repeat protein [Elusimicrobia bacterium]|nr:tetratricopeptide repeat protein [Elusimicrobiota bacterium]MBD3411544.1 tetratricopeptide repeat protein [Elusimicrobiota bacterium]